MELPEELPKGLPECIKSWVIKRTGKRKYECKLCHMEIVNTEQLRFHLRNGYHIKKVMQQIALHCDLCNIQCKFQSAYNIHIKTKKHLQKENPQPIVEHNCDDCAVKFRCRKQLELHLTTKKHLQKENPQPIVEHNCDDCAVKFRCRKQLEVHFASKKHINRNQSFNCDLCGIKFGYQSAYNTHIKTKRHLHKENPQPKPIIEYKCEDCKVTFQSNKDKLRHLTSKKHAKLAKTDSVSSKN